MNHFDVALAHRTAAALAASRANSAWADLDRAAHEAEMHAMGHPDAKARRAAREARHAAHTAKAELDKAEAVRDALADLVEAMARG